MWVRKGILGHDYPYIGHINNVCGLGNKGRFQKVLKSV